MLSCDLPFVEAWLQGLRDLWSSVSSVLKVGYGMFSTKLFNEIVNMFQTISSWTFVIDVSDIQLSVCLPAAICVSKCDDCHSRKTDKQKI